MTPSTSPWFSPADAPALADFGAVYFAHYDEVLKVTLDAALEDPQFGPIVRAMPPELMKQQNDEGLARMRRAMAGDWEEYEADLRKQGGTYALMGVEYAAWYRIVGAYGGAIVPRMVDAYASDPPRLARALVVMQAFLDHAMVIIAESYLSAKEAAVRRSEERLAITLDSIGDAVIATDAEGRVERLNPVAARLIGWSLEECRGRSLDEVFHIVNEETGAPVENPVARVLREGVVVGLANHTVLIARDRQRRPIADSAAPIRTASGDVYGVVLVFRDMTEERDAELALRASESRSRAVIESSLDAIIAMDHHGVIFEFNASAERTFGHRREDVVGRSLADVVIPPKLREAHRKGLARYLVSGQGPVIGKRIEVPALRADGSEFPAELAVVAAHGRGHPFFLGFVRDLTEVKRHEELRTRSVELELENRRAQEANRLKSEFLANMSHELRTPLNSVIGFSELLYDGEVEPVAPKQKEFLGHILASGRHLLQLINDVLDLSKVEAGKMDFHPEPVDLGRVIGEVSSILRATAASKNMRIEIEIREDVREVVLDAARLKQVLYNYLSNALKFTPEGGHVTVRAVPQDEHSLRLEVEDTGHGIAPEDLSRLFVEFQQLDVGAAKKHGGTGLGLALTKRLVEAQGGTVGVRSDLGNGSVFWAVLPRRMTAVASVSQPGPGATGGGPRVLVVEDDPADRNRIVDTLSDAGYTVDVAGTGARAIAMCGERHYEAITLDLILPDMSGLDVLRAVRGGARNADAVVVVITVVAEDATGGFAVDDVLAKPIDGAALLDSLRRAHVVPGVSGHVLVVDDDAGSLALMAIALEQLGYHAVCHVDAEQALRAAQAEPPVAVILDLLMPGTDGFAFLDKFRREPANRGIPVLIWTIKDLSPDERARLRASAQAVLVKGGGASDLVGALRTHLPRPAASAQE